MAAIFSIVHLSVSCVMLKQCLFCCCRFERCVRSSNRTAEKRLVLELVSRKVSSSKYKPCSSRLRYTVIVIQLHMYIFYIAKMRRNEQCLCQLVAINRWTSDDELLIPFPWLQPRLALFWFFYLKYWVATFCQTFVVSIIEIKKYWLYWLVIDSKKYLHNSFLQFLELILVIWRLKW